MARATMEARDSVDGSLAECYVTFPNGERYFMFSLTEFESKYEMNIVEVPILGKMLKGHKPAGGKGTWTGKMHYNSSAFRKWALRYVKTGELLPFEIQVTNEDPSSRAGRQTITHTGCLLDGVILAKFATGDDVLQEDISGTFDDWDMPEEFNVLDGMDG